MRISSFAPGYRWATRLAFLSAFACAAACSSSEAGGGGSSSGSSGQAGDGGTKGDAGEATCKSADATLELPGVDISNGNSTSHEVPQVSSMLGDGSVLVRSYDAAGAAHLSFVRPGIDTSNIEIASNPGVRTPAGGTYAFAAVALTLGGKRCALYLRDGETLKLACEGSAPEDSGVKMSPGGRTNGGNGLVPLVLPDGSLDVYGQGDFASYDGAARDASGKWRAVEKSESSISWGDDAVLHDGRPVVCFIGAGGGAALDTGGQKVRLGLKSNRCRMLGTATALHLLVDDGHLALPWDDFDSPPAPTKVDLGTAAPGPMFLLRDAAYVVVDRATKVEAVPLAGGAAIDLGVVGGLQAMRVDGATFRAATSKSIASNTGPYKAEIRVATRCIQ